MSDKIDRRQFIKEMSMAAAAVMLSSGVRRAEGRGKVQLAGPPKNVVILGGGLAGLAAAYELKRAGHKVTILEARKAAGGRVRTLRNFDDGLFAEAGPVSFPQNHTFTWDYADEFNLPVIPSIRFGLESIAHVRGSRFRITGGGASNVPFSLKASEREAGVFGLPALYLGSLMRDVGNPRKPGWPPDNLREIDNISLKQLLEELGASDGAIDLIEASQLGLLGFGIDSFSALDGVVTETIASGGLFHEIQGGNDKLPNAFKKKVKKQFKKQSVVLAISQNETSVTVTYSQNGSVQTITADRAICTLPFPILGGIEVSPPFPEDKQRAIRELKLTPITRTFLQFSSRPWEQDRLDGYGITDLSIQNTYSPTLTQGGRRGLLASYTGGQRALDWGAMSEGDRQTMTLNKMNSLFNNLGGKYEEGTSQVWQDDEWTRGAFTYFQPGQMTGLLPVAQRPEGRIHFAGEHTSAWHGWMNGALESGNRAAEEVNAAESAQTIFVRHAAQDRSA
ncbi:MAG TPA: FAD-dependent oxidoreductase [Blastocatellia bacterium]|nr:FAD-dependent oxidoreductase [Blastocatellia bacterium]